MREEYDFSRAKPASEIPALVKLQADKGKTRITLFLDDDVIEVFRDRASKNGKGYQTLINETLRASLSPEDAPVTVKDLRKELQQIIANQLIFSKASTAKNSKTRAAVSGSGESGVAKKRKIKTDESITDFHPA